MNTIFFNRHTIFDCDCLNRGGLCDLDITLDLHSEYARVAQGGGNGGISLE